MKADIFSICSSQPLFHMVRFLEMLSILTILRGLSITLSQPIGDIPSFRGNWHRGITVKVPKSLSILPVNYDLINSHRSWFFDQDKVQTHLSNVFRVFWVPFRWKKNEKTTDNSDAVKGFEIKAFEGPTRGWLCVLCCNFQSELYSSKRVGLKDFPIPITDLSGYCHTNLLIKHPVKAQ